MSKSKSPFPHIIRHPENLFIHHYLPQSNKEVSEQTLNPCGALLVFSLDRLCVLTPPPHHHQILSRQAAMEIVPKPLVWECESHCWHAMVLKT